MPIPVSTKTRVPFICKADDGTPKPPTFFLSPMTSATFSAICDELAEMEKAPSVRLTPQEDVANRVLKASLRGWRDWNFPDDAGVSGAVPYEADDKGEPTDATLALLDFNTKIELMGRAISLNQVSREARGN